MSRFFRADQIFTAFPIISSSGDLIGFVDSILSEASTIEVSGWTSADEVGLQCGNTRVSKGPDLPRGDVLTVFPDLTQKIADDRLGFHLIGQTESGGTYLFVRQGLDTYYFLV